MSDRKTIQALGCWTGYKLDRAVFPEGESRTLSLYLKPTGKVMYCRQCGAKCNQVHETVVRRVRDLPLFDYRVGCTRPGIGCGAINVAVRDWNDWIGWANLNG